MIVCQQRQWRPSDGRRDWRNGREQESGRSFKANSQPRAAKGLRVVRVRDNNLLSPLVWIHRMDYRPILYRL